MHFLMSMLVWKVQFGYHWVKVINYFNVRNISVFETAVVATSAHSCLGLWAEVCTALGGFSLRTVDGWHSFHQENHSVGKTLSQDTLDLCSVLSCPQIYTGLCKFLNIIVSPGTLVLREAFLISCASAVCERWGGTRVLECYGVAICHKRQPSGVEDGKIILFLRGEPQEVFE